MNFNWILFSRLSIIGSKAFTCQIILLIFIKANFIGELFWTTLLYRRFCYLLELREHSAPLPPLVPPQPCKARNTALEGLPKEQKYTLFIHRSIMTMTAYVLFVCLLAVCFFVCSFVFKLACFFSVLSFVHCLTCVCFVCSFVTNLIAWVDQSLEGGVHGLVSSDGGDHFLHGVQRLLKFSAVDFRQNFHQSWMTL